ncbi:MAG: four helix bundle protein [Bacteroidales bacterium]|nr:four helix bundle protein [Bacteroidales bacterium]
MKSFKDLKVWQKSYSLCLKIYTITRKFPSDERYGLTSQLRRASVSIPSNIAEGYGKKTTPEYIHSLYIANGSLCELETQILLANDLKYINAKEYNEIEGSITELVVMMKALIKSLEKKKHSTP